jgi:hypothetical protein
VPPHASGGCRRTNGWSARRECATGTRWLAALGLVAFIGQSVETVTIFGSAGFTQPGGAMNMQLGGGLTLAWILALVSGAVYAGGTRSRPSRDRCDARGDLPRIGGDYSAAERLAALGGRREGGQLPPALPEIVGSQRLPSSVFMSARIGFVWSVSI